MSVRSSGTMRVARSVANGEGDWAEVDPALRDAIVLAITQASPTPLRRVEGSRHRSVPSGALTTTSSSPGGALHLSSAAVPPVLTEGSVQSSILTFEDAAWVRDEAVRSYAEFHNTIEALHAAMRTQLHPVWKTSMQLRPGMLAEVRDHFQLRRTDNIPDGVPITTAAAQHITQQERILDEVEDTLQMLRNTSVRFAAHYLSDEEKLAMGANPAYLRAPDIDREVVESRTAQTLEEEEGDAPRIPQHQSSHSRAQHSPVSGLVSSKSNRRSRRSGDAGAAAAATANAPRPSTPTHAESGSHRAHQHRNRHSSRSDTRRSSSGQAATTTGNDPLLEELRKQYQQRMKELEAHSPGGASVERQGTWPQVGSAASSRTSRSPSSRSRH